MRLIFLGPPGAGKGTQSERICRDYNVIQLSTGDILRANIKKGTELGKLAGMSINKGELAPDDVMIDMIKAELHAKDVLNGYILDGFPRTVPQAIALDDLLHEMDKKLDVVLIIEASTDILIKRLSSRRTCRNCGKSYHLIYNPPKHEDVCDVCSGELYQRDDDTEEPIKTRLKIYEKQTFPLIQYYINKGIAEKIDGMGEIEDIYHQVKTVLERFK